MDDINERINNIIKADGKGQSTLNKMKWSSNIFNNWLMKKDQKTILSSLSLEEVKDFLPHFILEVRKTDDSYYPSNTLYDIILNIQNSLNFERNLSINIFKDNEFKNVRLVLNDEMKNLMKLGVGLKNEKSNVISVEVEDTLWRDNILNIDDPYSLLHTLIYVLGINLCLRGRQEHRNLTWKNFKIMPNGCLSFKESISKNNSGGIKNKKIKSKCVEIFQNLDNSYRCPIMIFNKYKSLCPKDIAETDPLYLTPLKKITEYCWYSKNPVGINTIAKATTNI
jgi:hypothetical protein